MFGFNLHAGPLAATEARHALMAAEDSLGEDERQPMLLMLTELVTNAIRHGEARRAPERRGREGRGVATAAWAPP